MTDRPVWLLDVDGVLNAAKAGWGAVPRSGHATSCGIEFRIRWSDDCVERIRQLHDGGRVEVRWATTWVGETTRIQELLALPHFDDAFTKDDMRRLGGSTAAKRHAALDVVQSGRRLIWTDDDAIPARGALLRTVLEEAGGLLIAPRSSRGLRPGDLARIEGYCCG
jgi:hypothetical protein